MTAMLGLAASFRGGMRRHGTRSPRTPNRADPADRDWAARRHILRIDTDAANHFAVTASTTRQCVYGRCRRAAYAGPAPADRSREYRQSLCRRDIAGRDHCRGRRMDRSGQHQNIFLFDRASGELKQRLTDLPNLSSPGLFPRWPAPRGIPAGAMAFAYSMLATTIGCCLAIRNTGSSYWAKFDRSGRLVTTSCDGFVRLYAADQYVTPIARFEAPGHHPFSAAFSPDGTRVAVGYLTIPRVVVLSGTDLTELFRPKTAGFPRWVKFGWMVGGWPLPVRGRLLVGKRRAAGASLEQRRPRPLSTYPAHHSRS